ncbi:imidazolonepropionase [Arthrobacter sp. zg-Y1110]|uniref:imidazolonepropionase n=1 Tax=Arthrobacter sp. zg-Y1110 TaxID=2886932 RepID=UPI001D13BA8A|nr:imidazolonepropionase [Arthrobacter sp. zg-Y1110]MCC3292649.1 imidazolonepropionase [Arthrobacter sp. zg-Y1110]UWX85937.1 imidazolonepropionase [Arthrobacter sp. zg-Y1110]
MSSASTLITNIGELSTQDDTADTPVLRDAAVVFEGERISWIGPAGNAPAADEVIDAGGRAGLPGWVDSHTHLVFAGDRSAEFEARMAGQAYEAGGIAVTTEATRAASDYDLTRMLLARAAEAAAGGTTYLETKTGYGLSVEEERRHARIASTVADTVTFLGAHLVPDGADADEYTELVCTDMLAAVRPYVQWADVFCEKGAFTEEQSRRVLQAARDAGLGLRVHGNQLGPGAGVRLAVEFGAASVDHVNHLSDDDVAALADTWSGWDAGTGVPGTVATCLPACDLSTRAPLAPARQLLDAGVQVALASNCNPGTSFTSSMAFCVATAVLQMGLTVQEAVRAATYGGALALRVHTGEDRDGARAVGSLAVGHRADLQLLNAPSAAHLAYRPGMPLTGMVFRAGVPVRR